MGLFVFNGEFRGSCRGCNLPPFGRKFLHKKKCHLGPFAGLQTSFSGGFSSPIKNSRSTYGINGMDINTGGKDPT